MGVLMMQKQRRGGSCRPRNPRTRRPRLVPVWQLSFQQTDRWMRQRKTRGCGWARGEVCSFPPVAAFLCILAMVACCKRELSPNGMILVPRAHAHPSVTIPPPLPPLSACETCGWFVSGVRASSRPLGAQAREQQKTVALLYFPTSSV